MTRDERLAALASALYETDPPESWMRTGTDEYRKRAGAMLDILEAASGSPEPVLDPESAILRAVESLHRERWPNESLAYDPAADPECRPIIGQAVRAALTALPSDRPGSAERKP